ncbi:hypothetical protein [Catenulispora yoronensis]
MGQRQGLTLLSVLAGVMVLLAAVAALGGFDDDPRSVAGASAGLGADPDARRSADGGSGGSGGADHLSGKAKASEILLASVQHYTDLLATGQTIIGTTHYASEAAYSQAFTDSTSPAAAFAKFRLSPNPEADATYTEAVNEATAAYDGKPGTLNQWTRDMAKAKWDLSDWVATASRYQQGTAAQDDLDAAAALVTQDLATAKADVAKLTG